MKNIILRLLVVSSLIALTACGGGGNTDGGNSSQFLAEARTISGNAVHGDTATEEYTLEFTAVDAAVSPSFTLYLWDLQFLTNQATVTQASLDIHIYPDGGTGESCTVNWSTGLTKCQFTSLNNSSQLNLDLTNNSGADISYSYIFLPGTTLADGSLASPHRIPDSVIYDTYIPVTAGIVGGVAGDSSYYVVNTGSAGTAFDRSIIAVTGGSNSELSLDLYSDSNFTNSVYSCADLSSTSCDTMYGLTANTDYYLKITSNGSAGAWIVYQLDLIPSNAAYVDNGINIDFQDISNTYSGEAYSVYMFDSNGVAVAGVWADHGTLAAGGGAVKLKTLDANGCVTTIDAPRIDSGTYTFVSGTKLTQFGETKPAACTSTSGYIRIATKGFSIDVDMSTISAYGAITMYPYTMANLWITVVSGTSSNAVYCSVYDYNYTGADDKYRLGGKTSIGGINGDVARTWVGINVPQGGSYRIRCLADMDNDGIETSGDSVFELPFYSNYDALKEIDATSGWTVVP